MKVHCILHDLTKFTCYRTLCNSYFNYIYSTQIETTDGDFSKDQKCKSYVFKLLYHIFLKLGTLIVCHLESLILVVMTIPQFTKNKLKQKRNTKRIHFALHNTFIS